MRYAITPGVLGIPGSIDIPADKFTKLRSAQKDFIYVLNSEETFDLLFENYADRLFGAQLKFSSADLVGGQ